MVVKQVNEQEIKKALLTALIAEILNKYVNFETVLFLINNIKTQIDNVLDPKQNQQNVVNAILVSGGTTQRQFVGRQLQGSQRGQEILEELNETLEVQSENVTMNIPKNVRIDTNKQKQEIEDLRQASSRFVDYYNEMTQVLENEDVNSLTAYSRMYDDVIRRIEGFRIHLQGENQNYLSKTFLVNMAVKTIFDDDISPANRDKLRKIFSKTEELFGRFEKTNQLNHTKLINDEIDKTQNEPNLIKYYISIIKRIGNYIEINSTDLEKYKFAIEQGKRYLTSMKFCINQFGGLKGILPEAAAGANP